jgi:hypothetical protein
MSINNPLAIATVIFIFSGTSVKHSDQGQVESQFELELNAKKTTVQHCHEKFGWRRSLKPQELGQASSDKCSGILDSASLRSKERGD